MIVRAVEAVTWTQWALIVLAGLWLSAPVVAWLDAREDRKNAERWSRMPGATR